MKSKIFSTDQIRAIQDGRMTQFMQVVKPQPDLITNVIGGVTWQQSKDKYIWGSDTAELLSDMMQECPFGKIGDVIYCRETWTVYQTINHIMRPITGLLTLKKQIIHEANKEILSQICWYVDMADML